MKRHYVLGLAAVIVLTIIRGARKARPVDGIASPLQSRPMIEVLEPLDTEVLVRRSVDMFPSGYLNNISIIQGVALASLIDRAYSSWHRPTPVQGAMLIGESVFLLLGIIIVAYEYLWFLTVMRWTPTFRDTLVPFVLGVSEIVPQLFLGTSTAWWIGIGTFTLIGAGAFWNTINRLRPNLFGRYRQVHDQILRTLRVLVACCLVLTVAEVSLAIFSRRVPQVVPLIVMWGLVLSTVLVVYISERGLDQIYAHLGVNRRPGRYPDASDVE